MSKYELDYIELSPLSSRIMKSLLDEYGNKPVFTI